MKARYIKRRATTSRIQRTVTLLLAWIIVLSPAATAHATGPLSESSPNPPVFAYYYIWFNTTSWNRAKVDLPLLGPYSSDDEEVMRQHVKWAKSSGIDGFIVSWKHTETLTRRLDQLVEISHEEDFKLVIIYEGLDFYRAPLPVERISFDLSFFTSHFAGDPVFDVLGKPVVIWSGTWKYTRDEIAFVTSEHRANLQILASAKNDDEYKEIEDLVDGNAYYWSSVDPSTFPDYPGKLQRMRDATAASGGLWIAPAAPGFDARHLGGEREVPRHDGAMLETQFETARGSAPDAIGLISWNEFSESSHIEPSCLYGDRYLAVMAELLGGTPPSVDIPCDEAALATALEGSNVTSPVAMPQSTPPSSPVALFPFEWDSSAPQGLADRGARLGTLTLLGLFGGLMAFSAVMITRRALNEEEIPSPSTKQVNSLPTGGEIP